MAVSGDHVQSNHDLPAHASAGQNPQVGLGTVFAVRHKAKVSTGWLLYQGGTLGGTCFLQVRVLV